MSAETFNPSSSPASAERELRIIALHNTQQPSHGSEEVILPHNTRLATGHYIIGNESIEQAATRIAAEKLDQPYMTAVARLLPIDNIDGYVVEAQTGKKTDLRRSFAGKAFQLDMLLKDAQERPDQYDPIDIELLQSYSDRTYEV